MRRIFKNRRPPIRRPKQTVEKKQVHDPTKPGIKNDITESFKKARKKEPEEIEAFEIALKEVVSGNPKGLVGQKVPNMLAIFHPELHEQYTDSGSFHVVGPDGKITHSATLTGNPVPYEPGRVNEKGSVNFGGITKKRNYVLFVKIGGDVALYKPTKNSGFTHELVARYVPGRGNRLRLFNGK